ncbi:MAG: alpha/beta hydrolase-fold protein [Ancrocorticia sp.]
MTTPEMTDGRCEFDLRSAAGSEYRILVARSLGAPPPEGYSVLFLLDGDAYFEAAAGFLQMQSAFPQLGPGGTSQLLIVGIGYPGASPLHQVRRTRDFLPEPKGLPQEQIRILGAEPGGAHEFLRFITTELRHALRERYPIREVGHTLAGHSLGGYFALHALVNSSGFFQKYAAISPALWWENQRLVDEVMCADVVANPEVLLAVASDELPGYPDRSAAMLDAARNMRGALEERGIGDVQYMEVDGEDHLTMPFALMPSIVRFAFGRGA